MLLIILAIQSTSPVCPATAAVVVPLMSEEGRELVWPVFEKCQK